MRRPAAAFSVTRIKSDHGLQELHGSARLLVIGESHQLLTLMMPKFLLQALLARDRSVQCRRGLLNGVSVSYYWVAVVQNSTYPPLYSLGTCLP